MVGERCRQADVLLLERVRYIAGDTEVADGAPLRLERNSRPGAHETQLWSHQPISDRVPVVRGNFTAVRVDVIDHDGLTLKQAVPELG